MLVHYTKPALSVADQITLLKSRGLVINDQSFVEHRLAFIGYYRLSAYCKSFQDNDIFHSQTHFEQILDLYVFDRKLKSLFFDGIERIEIALRSVLSNVMTDHFGAFWFLDSNAYSQNFNFHQELVYLKEKIESAKRKDGFLRNFYEKYSEEWPPCWMLMESISFGDVLNLFQTLDRKYRREIAFFFNLDEKILISWLKGILDIRNISAHHERLWNRNIKIPLIPRYAPQISLITNNRKVFNYLIIINYFLKILSPDSQWFNITKDLLKKSSIPYFQMGCPNNWQDIFISK